MKTATGILIVSLLAIESFAVDFLLVRDGRNVWVRDSDPFAYESRVARLNGAESITDETGTYCLYEGVKYYDVDAEAEAMAGPDPELFVPALDENGNKVGTARIVVRAATWELVPLTNKASPKRVWLVQRDEYKSRIARSDALKNRIKGEKAKWNGNAALIGRVSALEAKEGVE